jgi:hypothetical protein
MTLHRTRCGNVIKDLYAICGFGASLACQMRWWRDCGFRHSSFACCCGRASRSLDRREGQAVSLHIDRQSAIWLVTLVLGVGLHLGSVMISGRHQWTPDVPDPLGDIFRNTPVPMRVFMIILSLVLVGTSFQVWRPSERAMSANERSAAIVQQLQNYYFEAEEHRLV